jgi:hypothetical protein
MHLTPKMIAIHAQTLARFPGANKASRSLTFEERKKIYGGNAVRIYNIPVSA